MRRFVPIRPLLGSFLTAALMLSAQPSHHSRTAKSPPPRTKATVLAVSCDTACTWTLDGNDEQSIAAGGSARVSLEPGQHVLVATTSDGTDQIKKEFAAEAGTDTAFELRLLRVRIARLKKELADQEEKIKKFNASTDDNPQDADHTPIPPPAPVAPQSSPAQQTNESLAPPSAPETPATLEISSTVASDMLIARTLPVYPTAARAMGISGTVVLHYTITRDGQVADLTVVSGPELLQKAATDAVSTWKFTPYLVNGHPMDVTTRISIEFKLNKPAPPSSSPRN